MYQQITLVGNLGRDPEMRYAPSGSPVTNFSVATSRGWTGEDGQRQEKTVWFRVAAWQRLAETCNQYLSKGSRVMVVGEVEEPYVWTDESGNSRASLQVRARTVQFLSSRAEAGEQSDGQPVYADGENAPSPDAGSDVDVPF
jgi:single-strand DNA-binding protein